MGQEVRRGLSTFKVPAWARWPPMRVLPKDRAERRAVIERWAKLLLDWASATRTVAISISELAQTPPFDVEPALLRAVVERLIEMGLAKRCGKETLVFYWRGPEGWAKAIYEWLRENYFEVFSVQDLLEADQPFSHLPLDELRRCLSILEREGLIRRVKGIKGYYKLVLPGVL